MAPFLNTFLIHLILLSCTNLVLADNNSTTTSLPSKGTLPATSTPTSQRVTTIAPKLVSGKFENETVHNETGEILKGQEQVQSPLLRERGKVMV